MNKRVQGGFTLIELLCSLCIILILASLLIGPVFKAFKKVKRLQGENTAWELMERFRERMAKHFGEAEKYPARTVEELYAAGYIDGNIRDFFRKKEVKYIPFSSTTPDTEPILMVEVAPGEIATLLKADIRPKR
jgi:prepilin-type N-terminal cleavage/methylation domain-containing protein